MRRAQVIEPYIRELAPDLIIVSAGFDAAKGDLLGGMRLSPACYGAPPPQRALLLWSGVLVVRRTPWVTADASSRISGRTVSLLRSAPSFVTAPQRARSQRAHTRCRLHDRGAAAAVPAPGAGAGGRLQRQRQRRVRCGVRRGARLLPRTLPALSTQRALVAAWLTVCALQIAPRMALLLALGRSDTRTHARLPPWQRRSAMLLLLQASARTEARRLQR
jgi:hypothetical protein